MNRTEQIHEIEVLLTKYDRRIASAFMEGVRNISDSITLNQIEQAIRSGNLSAASSIVSDAMVAAGFVTFSRTLQDALIAGGDHASRIASASRVEFGFQVAESNVARFLSQYQAAKVKEISLQFRQAISAILQREAAAGTNPLETARRIKAGLGLTMTQEAAVENYRLKLQNLGADALANRLRDKRFDPMIERMIREGKTLTPEKIEQMVAAYRRKYIARRAENIARTESVTMLSKGQDAYWNQLLDAGVVTRDEVIRSWIVTRDNKLRDAHAGIPALNPQGRKIGEPFLSSLGPIQYPGDPSAVAANRINCRCALFTRIER